LSGWLAGTVVVLPAEPPSWFNDASVFGSFNRELRVDPQASQVVV